MSNSDIEGEGTDLQAKLDAYLSMLGEHPELIESEAFLCHVVRGFVRCEASMPETLEFLAKVALHSKSAQERNAQQLKEVKDFLKSLEETLDRGVVLSSPYMRQGIADAWFCDVMLPGSPAAIPFRVNQDLDPSSITVPCLSWLNRDARLVLSIEPWASHSGAPLPARIVTAVGAHKSKSSDAIGEVEILEIQGSPGEEDATRLIRYAEPSLAEDIRQRQEAGETVRVREESNLIITEVVANEQEVQHPPWEVHVDPETSETLDDLVLPSTIRTYFRNAAKAAAAKEATFVICTGPAGCGKSEIARRLPLQVHKEMEGTGENPKGAVMIDLNTSTAGSTFVCGVEITMGKAIRRAKHLRDDGYAVTIRLDEMNSLLSANDHSFEGHSLRWRQTLQTLLGGSHEDFAGIIVIGTLNDAESGSGARQLTSAIENRFETVAFSRASRSQCRELIRLRTSQCPHLSTCVHNVGLTPEAFSTVVADKLFGERIIGEVEFESREKRPIRVRDLQQLSCRQVVILCNAMRRGVVTGGVNGNLVQAVDAWIERMIQGALKNMTARDIKHHLFWGWDDIDRNEPVKSIRPITQEPVL